MQARNHFGKKYNAENQTIDLSGVSLHHQHTNYWGILFKYYSELRGLNLSHNQLKEAGKYLAAIAKSKTQLAELVLESCGLSASSIKALSFVIVRHPSLTMLNLSHNPIGSEGAEHIADGAWGCSGLKFLFLRNCGIGNSACGALAAIIKKHPSLHYIDLRNNLIGDKGMREIAEAITEGLFNPGLIIRLDYNQIGSPGEYALSCALTERLPAGLRITLKNNPLPHESWDRLHDRFDLYKASVRIKRALFFQVMHQDQSPLSKLPKELLDVILCKTGLVRPHEVTPLEDIEDRIEMLAPQYFAFWRQPTIEKDDDACGSGVSWTFS